MEYSAKQDKHPNEWIVTETDEDELQTDHRVACKPTDSSAAAAIAIFQGLSAGDPVLSLDAQKAMMTAQVNRFHSQTLRRLTGAATDEEQATWPVKMMAAKAVKAGAVEPEQVVMLTPEADAKGIDIATLSDKILLKNAECHESIGMVAGLRTQGFNMIEAATTSAELDEVLPTLQVKLEEA